MTHYLLGKARDRKVWLDDKELLPGRSQQVYNHSPDGFNWGYGGSGPAQLALAVMLELNEKDYSNFYQSFKNAVIAQLPLDKDFSIIFDDEKFTFTHIERGLRDNVKQIIYAPKNSTKEMIDQVIKALNDAKICMHVGTDNTHEVVVIEFEPNPDDHTEFWIGVIAGTTVLHYEAQKLMDQWKSEDIQKAIQRINDETTGPG